MSNVFSFTFKKMRYFKNKLGNCFSDILYFSNAQHSNNISFHNFFHKSVTFSSLRMISDIFRSELIGLQDKVSVFHEPKRTRAVLKTYGKCLAPLFWDTLYLTWHVGITLCTRRGSTADMLCVRPKIMKF